MRPDRYRQKPKPTRHEIPAWVGVPLWALGGFLRKHWRTKAYIAALVFALYLPSNLHTHAHYKDNQRCDRTNYTAQVLFQYGCTGRSCSEDALAYEQKTQMLLAALTADCHPKPPWTPTRQIRTWKASFDRSIEPLNGLVPEQPEIDPAEVEYAENS